MSRSRFLRAVTEYPNWFSCRIERKMVIFPDKDISPGDARVVFGNSGKLYMQTSSQTDLQHAGCEELESVRQSVHLLPRSVIYFEDFLSPCISHHALLYALCVAIVRACDRNIFLIRGTKHATWNILVHDDASIRGRYTWRGEGTSGAGIQEENKRSQFLVDGFLFDSIRS